MASRYSLIARGVLLLFLIGCRPATPPPSLTLTQESPEPATEASSPVRSTSVPDQAADILSAEYELGASESQQTVTLTDGKFEQGIPGSDDFMSILLTEYAAAGDLNNDGNEEVAVLISENYGGTGVFVFLAVYAKVNGNLTFQTSVLVDDRPQLNTLSIANNEIFLDAVIHGADEPMCCPTLRTTRHYRLVESQLDLVDYTTFTPDGQPRTITIESPPDGADTFASVQVRGTVAVAPFENNLIYRLVDLSGIELAAGAVPVTAPEPGAPGTFESTIRLGNALSGSIIRLEIRDVSAADGSLLAMDSVELVVK